MTLEGIAPDPLERWFEAHVPEVVLPVSYELIAGGRSNLTYRVVDASGAAFVLRRPPVGPVLPTAHDMAREHRIISALGSTAVPVARAVARCDDAAILGAPFYVMGHVEGHVLRGTEDAAAVLDETARAAVSRALVDTLVDIHAVDPEEVGLGDLGRRDAYVPRQLARWQAQLHRSVPDDGARRDRVVELDAMRDRLATDVPLQQGATLVHGDYRLNNTIVGADGSVRAVLDWETCTLGDPLADLAILLIGWQEPADDDLLGMAGLGLVPTALPGFLDRAGVVDRYGERCGRDVSHLPYYVAFAWWRMACIFEGVAARYATGSGGGERTGAEHLVARADGAAEEARRAMARL